MRLPALTTSTARLLLGAILALGAALRFAGLGHGLRHEPIADEAYFVDAARAVVETGDPDHRFHEYPGLPVYVLVPVVALLGDRGTAAVYLGARSVIALSGVLSIGLAFLLGRRLAGPAAGLYAAAATAVSTIDVRVAHEYRPDVMLGTTAVAALLAWSAPASSIRRGALRDGAAVGLATATKFSGAILGPVWALGLPWPRREAFVSAGLGLLASLATFAVLSPYSVLDPAAMQEGTGTQAAYHFDRARPFATLLPIGLSYLQAWWRSFGPGGLLLAVAGAVLLLRGPEARRRLPLVALPIVTVLVFSTSPIRHERFLLVASAALAALAAVAVARVAATSRAAAVALAVAGLAPPLATSVEIAQAYRTPKIEDDTLDWIHANLPSGSRVLTGVQPLGLDPRRYETRKVMTKDLSPRAALEWDYVVFFAGAEPPWAARLDLVHALQPRTEFSGVAVNVRRAPDALRPRTEPLDLSGARIRASSEDALGSLTDGRVDTAWSSGPPQAGTEWIEVAWTEPRWLGRVVVDQPADAAGAPRNLRVLVSVGGGPFGPARTDLGRLPAREQETPGPRADVVLLDAADVTGVRLEQEGRGPRPWQVAELRIEALEDVPGWATLQGRRIRREATGASRRSGARRPAPRP